MFRNKVWLLSALAPFGLLGIPLHQPALYMLFAFALFLGLYRIDERNLAVLGRAALISFFVTIFVYMLGAPWFIMLIDRQPKSVTGPAWDNWLYSLTGFLGGSLVVVLLVSTCSFLASYFYLNARGLKQ